MSQIDGFRGDIPLLIGSWIWHMSCIMGLALQRIFVWQWCDHWFAQKRPTATRHRIANNMSLMLASKHAHAIGAISDSIHMLIALHRRSAMGIQVPMEYLTNSASISHMTLVMWEMEAEFGTYSDALCHHAWHALRGGSDSKQNAQVANLLWPKAAFCFLTFFQPIPPPKAAQKGMLFGSENLQTSIQNERQRVILWVWKVSDSGPKKNLTSDTCERSRCQQIN